MNGRCKPEQYTKIMKEVQLVPKLQSWKHAHAVAIGISMPKAQGVSKRSKVLLMQAWDFRVRPDGSSQTHCAGLGRK